MNALAGSIGKRGVLQPVLVRSLEDGKYELIVGERRWRAAMIAGLQRIPALVCPFDDEEALEAALIENMAREDLYAGRGGPGLRDAGAGVRSDLSSRLEIVWVAARAWCQTWYAS